MDDENKNKKGEIDNQQKAWDESQKQIKSLLRKIDDLESKVRKCCHLHDLWINSVELLY